MNDLLHPLTELGKVKLNVSDLERSIQFYEHTIGFSILHQTASSVELTADGSHALLELEEVPNAQIFRPGSTAGLYHFAILLPNRKDLGLALKNLIQNGVSIGSADHLVSEALYLSDPDHNGIEIYRDRPRHTWKIDERGHYLMATDPLDVQGLLTETGEDSWTGLPAEAKIGHVHLHVSNLPQSKQFYNGLLCLDITVESYFNAGMLFVAAGGYHHHIGLNNWAGEGAPARPDHAVGLAYYTIVLPDKRELDHYLQVLQKNQVPLLEVEGGWFITDPSGIQIRLAYKS